MAAEEKIDGIVKKITSKHIIVETGEGVITKLPIQAGEIPAIGSAVTIVSHSGSPKIAPGPIICEANVFKRYLHMYAIEEETLVPTSTKEAGDHETTTGKIIDKTTNTPFAFLDLPIGANTLSSANGNLVFAGLTSVGMATSCESKLLLTEDGRMEFITPHLVSLQGKCIVVSDFVENIHIEIDIENIDASGGTHGIDAIKQSIATKLEDISEQDYSTFEEIFEAEYSSFAYPALLKTFGVHLTEILLLFQWTRIKFRGSHVFFRELFPDSLCDFSSLYDEYLEGYTDSDKIVSIEIFIGPGVGDNDLGTFKYPDCEDDVTDTIHDISLTINADPMYVYRMDATLNDGTIIQFFKKKRVYSSSMGIMGSKLWISGDQVGYYGETTFIDPGVITGETITVEKAPDMCGVQYDPPMIEWIGDFTLSVSDGTLNLVGDSDVFLIGADTATVGGGGRAIVVDTDGTKTVTV